MSGLAAYRKAIAALIGAVMTWALPALVQTHGHPSAEQWYGLAVAVLTALGVYGVPNDLPATALHTVTAAIGWPAAGGRANPGADAEAMAHDLNWSAR